MKYYVTQGDDEYHWPVSVYDNDNSTFYFKEAYDADEDEVMGYSQVLKEIINNQINNADAMPHYILEGIYEE